MPAGAHSAPRPFRQDSCAVSTPKARFLSFFLLWRLHGTPKHGYLLIEETREIALTPSKPSTIYAVLSRLEKCGLVRSFLDQSGAHPRRLYQTTPAGWKLYLEIRKKRMKGVLLEFVSSLVK